ncbi:TetR/AcrR family transcriptional regulator [Rhodovulum sp. BSW8]|uniref:TetR/AcrR family transcriptional regulator n=1 Tax=Rhodovulum visakhapatnamense TaxID=364297 RepID=A0ABS1RDA9_9RHOB|nr:MULTISPECIES: TetR/AcrR family transcriptional regulator [Rhodovulum]MBL3568166.1 TetR/AcrR family transcriptional regulator [Rhodovulum visakhapatnamense]MBL3577505.1 TetR/AcrR family transcriptional regulator [Rhodovulum visakhapatnamense]OLS45302.1 hypothetical protein BV509_13795 [Rhodovulum sulfidophilum]RBO55013.1 TetR/AcrR family transcriptional regulator [Rhodovulum sp. BSW8]
MPQGDSRTDSDTCPGGRVCRRHAAGEDPAKRDQILQGAMKEFLEKGFDGASMNEICRAAGVSKGTLYVYFEDKLDLFVALVAREREAIFAGFDALLKGDLPLEDKLTRFGQRLASTICTDHVIQWQRTIAGIVDRMPELGARFYEAAAQRTHDDLNALLRRERAAGRLDVPDPERASAQFIELTVAGIWRARLFGKRRTDPEPDEIEASVASAVQVFMAAYGRTSG